MTDTDAAKAIESVIQSYLDGLHEGDAVKIASAFHQTSALTSISEAGELAITPRDVWLDNVRNRPSPKQRGLSRHDEVLRSTWSARRWPLSNSAARSRPRFFTDQLSLLKIDGRWQIAQKVFMTELRE